MLREDGGAEVDGEEVGNECEKDVWWDWEDLVGGVKEGGQVGACFGRGEVGFGGDEEKGWWEGWVGCRCALGHLEGVAVEAM